MKLAALLIAAVISFAASGFASPAPVTDPVKTKAQFTGDHFALSQVDVVPKIVYRTAPIYPFDLRRAGIQGYAIVEFIVDVKGLPQQVQCVEASHKAFGASTVKSVSQWRFKAAKKAGKPVAYKIQQRMEFNLNSE